MEDDNHAPRTPKVFAMRGAREREFTVREAKGPIHAHVALDRTGERLDRITVDLRAITGRPTIEFRDGVMVITFAYD